MLDRTYVGVTGAVRCHQMRTRALAVVAITVGVACGPRVVRAPETVSGDELTLYRDRAVLRKRVEVTIP